MASGDTDEPADAVVGHCGVARRPLHELSDGTDERAVAVVGRDALGERRSLRRPRTAHVGHRVRA